MRVLPPTHVRIAQQSWLFVELSVQFIQFRQVMSPGKLEGYVAMLSGCLWEVFCSEHFKVLTNANTGVLWVNDVVYKAALRRELKETDTE